MEDDCLFFPELYRLQDQADESGLPPNTRELRNLIDLCTLCGLCPCQDIKMLILQAKAAFSDEKGIPLSSRMLSDIETIGRWGTTFSQVINPLKGLKPVVPLVKKALKIHPQRDLPGFPKQSFFLWAKKKGLDIPNPGNRGCTSKVAYFAGCSAGYLFPEVGKAAVRLLERNGIAVYVPTQECCSMPLIMEGDKTTSLKKIAANMERLLQCVQDGYDIVCSCPTCGYFFKKLLLENAYYSEAFQEQSGAGSKAMKVPLGGQRFTLVSRGSYRKLLKDDGYFSSLDPLKRIKLSNSVTDLGEYLLSIYLKGDLNINRVYQDVPMVYYAPCHLREQKIGQPYYSLLKSLEGSDIIQIGEAMECCGMGGHLGYKKSFHAHTLEIGQPLFKRFLSEKNRMIITDCLSCKIQFEQMLARKVFHPLELL
ncbi:GlpC [Desulforapulum autotrophicum HRM2]|uniref:GlpC n=2 Tax=Desulforapulum autotrophicum TaxID=2296 RepID=C0Q9F4_DESAH|nr:GlpC [Desulforapulum autotrophicum HRM2]